MMEYLKIYFHSILMLSKKVGLLIKTSIFILIFINGFLIIKSPVHYYLSHDNQSVINIASWLDSFNLVRLLDIPRFVLGLSLMLISIFTLNNSRIAWVFSLFLLIITAVIDFYFSISNYYHGFFQSLQ